MEIKLSLPLREKHVFNVYLRYGKSPLNSSGFNDVAPLEPGAVARLSVDQADVEAFNEALEQLGVGDALKIKKAFIWTNLAFFDRDTFWSGGKVNSRQASRGHLNRQSQSHHHNFKTVAYNTSADDVNCYFSSCVAAKWDVYECECAEFKMVQIPDYNTTVCDGYNPYWVSERCGTECPVWLTYMSVLPGCRYMP